MRAFVEAILVILLACASALAQDNIPLGDVGLSGADNITLPPEATTPAAPSADNAPTPVVPGGPAKMKADVATRHQEDGTTTLFLTGHVELTRGTNRMEADRAAVWIDEARSKETGKVVMDVYAEGNVLTVEEGMRSVSPRVFFRWASTDLTVDDTDGFIAAQENSFTGDFFARAEGVRRTGGFKPEAGGIALKGRAPSGILEPGRIGYIYGQQQEGPDIRSHVEGDWRVTVVTRYPDIVFYDPRKADGNMEILAENMVIWVNEKKTAGQTGLKEAELQFYAEGHVVIYQGKRTIQCEQLFYDFKSERGLLIGGPGGNAVIEAYSELRKVPFYYRAKELRQVASDQYQGKDVIITTCEFPEPGWGIYSKKMTLTTGTEVIGETPDGDPITRPMERAEAIDSKLVLDGVPVFYWPYFTRDLKDNRTVLKNIRMLSSSQFGFSLLSTWGLYDLGIYQNDWSQALLHVDEYSKRGLGLGLDFAYTQPTYFGHLFVYGINDKGTDRDGTKPDPAQRDRVKWQHRDQLNENWRLDAEVNWISDHNFLDEYWQKEAREEKEPETYLYLRYLKDNRTFSALARWRLNDFQTQNEYLPELRFVWLGEPLFGGPLTYIQDTRVGDIRRAFNTTLQKTGALPADYESFRFTTEHELQLPLRVGIFNVAPFVDFSWNYYDHVVSGGPDQAAVTAGVRASTTFWKVYDVYNSLLDVNRVKHIVTPYVEVASTVLATKDPSEILQFDDRDTLEEGSVVRLGLRQRWQTRRLARTVAPDGVHKWNDVDWMTLNLYFYYFTHPVTFATGEHFSPLRAEYTWQLTDRVALLADADVQFENGLKLQTFDFGFYFDRSPRLSVYVGDRYIAESKSNILIGSVNYKVDERWTVNALAQIDLLQNTTNNYRIVLQRRLHCWIMEIGTEWDLGRHDRSYTLMFWPLGVPEARLRFF